MVLYLYLFTNKIFKRMQIINLIMQNIQKITKFKLQITLEKRVGIMYYIRVNNIFNNFQKIKGEEYE